MSLDTNGIAEMGVGWDGEPGCQYPTLLGSPEMSGQEMLSWAPNSFVLLPTSQGQIVRAVYGEMPHKVTVSFLAKSQKCP